MHKRLCTALLVVSMLASSAAVALERPYSLGVGSYTSGFGNADIALNFSGYSLTASYAFHEFFALRGSMFATTNVDWRSETGLGGDVSALAGVNLAKPGFAAYLGAGAFSDTIKDATWSNTTTGLQAVAGAGYNWRSAGIELYLSRRSAADYADYYQLGDAAVAFAAGLAASYRF